MGDLTSSGGVGGSGAGLFRCKKEGEGVQEMGIFRLELDREKS